MRPEAIGGMKGPAFCHGAASGCMNQVDPNVATEWHVLVLRFGRRTRHRYRGTVHAKRALGRPRGAACASSFALLSRALQLSATGAAPKHRDS